MGIKSAMKTHVVRFAIVVFGMFGHHSIIVQRYRRKIMIIVNSNKTILFFFLFLKLKLPISMFLQHRYIVIQEYIFYFACITSVLKNKLK